MTNDKYENTFQVIPAAIVIGIVGGALGALFINVNFRMNALRKKLLTTKWIKPIETAIWSFTTGFLFVSVPFLIFIGSKDKVCQSLSSAPNKDDDIVYKGWCNEGFIDPNASLFWGSEGGIIRTIMQREVNVTPWNMFFFLLTWYGFTITTYGTNVPAGLFLPGMIIGCALGRCMFNLAY